MKYILNSAVFRRSLAEMGYLNVLDFSRKTGIHRNTIKNYLSGKEVFALAFTEIADRLEAMPLELIIPVSDVALDIENIDELKPVVAQLKLNGKDIAILLIGSRAGGRPKKYSDWDIGITRTPKPVTDAEYLRLKQVVDDSADDLPRGVDLVNLDAAPLWYLEEMDYEPLLLDGSRESYIYFKGVLNGIKKRK